MSAPTPGVRPFSVHVAEEVLDDLRARLRSTRWPPPAPGVPWEQGTDLSYLQDLVAYWATGYDWRSEEQRLNGFAQYRTEVDGVTVHFVHEPARTGQGIPLVLTHGWPSSFIEMLPLVPFLTEPSLHGAVGRPFDVVIPSLPGYGLSTRPARDGMTTRHTAGLWHKLMGRLGYDRYAAHGTDFGAGVTTYLALDHPDALLGVHLSNLEIEPYTGPGSRPLSAAERSYVAEADRWWQSEMGYKAIQATRPQTLAYGLNDSPAALAAWILDKWRSWSDCAGTLAARFSPDVLLTTLTLYWATETIASSIRDYYDNMVGRTTSARREDYVDVPTAVAVFGHSTTGEPTPPREWAERLYDVQRWTDMPRGGHFAALEEPELLARDISAFFASLPDARGRS